MDQKIVQRNIRSESEPAESFLTALAEFTMNAQILKIVGNCAHQDMTGV